MPIGITEEHEELQQVARRWVEQHSPPAVVRSVLDAENEELPPFWSALAEVGWLGLHIAEEHGGVGYGVSELAVVLEELGHAAAPGPFLPTVLAAAVLQDDGSAGAVSLLAGLASGELIGTVALGAPVSGERTSDGLRLTGAVRPVVSGHLATHVVLPVRVGDAEVWCIVGTDAAKVRQLRSLDPTRRVAAVDVDGVVVPPAAELANTTRDRVRDLAVVMFAVEAVGLAQWCVETSSEYAKVRVQFGRPVGQFQGVKHRCAEMLSRTELARAAAWDAARSVNDAESGSFAAATAGALAIDAAFQTAKDNVQNHGGIGFTWEHDSHIYLKRTHTTRQLLGSGKPWRRRVAGLALDGVRRRLATDLPEDAEVIRTEVRVFLDEIEPLDAEGRRRRLADEGYLAVTWPRPWGRAAGAIEQLVIDEEFTRARITRPTLNVGGWALPPLMVYGTQEQQDRWIPPTLYGEIKWCQLFSEPGAGSDLASLTTRAQRVEGGYLVNGQKVWSSGAHEADWGQLLARTDPDAPKHNGISNFMLDMRSPGIDVRPLVELTGEPWFNEVFFDDVFIPEDCLVGAENDGWRGARTTLANERVFMGRGASIGLGVEGILRLLRETGVDDDPLLLDDAGRFVAQGHALAALGFRMTLKALSGTDPSGSEAAVRKLLSSYQDQDVQEFGLSLLGGDGVVNEGEAMSWVHGFLFNRCLTIAGGTSEVQKNVIAERLLGLPRDP